MPNHDHLLVTPRLVAARWLAPLKGFTAFRASELLGSYGQAFWQDESYDHLIRSAAQFDRIRSYTELNPVKAGLVAHAPRYPWSSVSGRLKGGSGQDWPPHIL
jgi:REP element-mobilizing transposase RayT